MNLKSLFISSYMTLIALIFCVSVSHVARQFDTPWLATLLSTLPGIAFFMYLFFNKDTPRTPQNLFVIWIVGLLLLTAEQLTWPNHWLPLFLTLLIGVIYPVFYDRWYSVFSHRHLNQQLVIGQTLIQFPLADLNGNMHFSSEFFDRTTLWVFFRGNWCPICMAQIQEVAAQYRELQQRGVRVVMISPQPAEHSKQLAQRFDAPMTFLHDADNQAAKALGILDENGLPMGLGLLGYDSDVPMPTVILTSKGGEILYCDLTENYRIRPEPSAFLHLLDEHARHQSG